MSCQDRFAFEKSLCTEWVHQNLQVTAIRPTMAVTPIGRSVWSDPASGDLCCNAFPTRCLAKSAEVSDAALYQTFAGPTVVKGPPVIAEGGRASV